MKQAGRKISVKMSGCDFLESCSVSTAFSPFPYCHLRIDSPVMCCLMTTMLSYHAGCLNNHLSSHHSLIFSSFKCSLTNFGYLLCITSHVLYHHPLVASFATYVSTPRGVSPPICCCLVITTHLLFHHFSTHVLSH